MFFITFQICVQIITIIPKVRFIVYDETDSEDSQINPTANMLATFDRITQNERERISDYDDIQRTNGIIIDSITGAPR